MAHAIKNDLKHIFDVLEKALFGLTNREPPNTPVFQHDFQPGPDVVRLTQLLVKLIHDDYPSVEIAEETKPAQSCSASSEQEGDTQVPQGFDPKSSIVTTPDDFKLFEKWASTPRFKSVVETYEPQLNPLPYLKSLTWM
jgi:hypothetical protein